MTDITIKLTQRAIDALNARHPSPMVHDDPEKEPEPECTPEENAKRVICDYVKLETTRHERDAAQKSIKLTSVEGVAT